MKFPSLAVSVAPVVMLLLFLAGIMIFEGTDAISSYSHIALLCSAASAVVLAFFSRSLCRRGLQVGFCRSARQILPAVPMLVFIALIATTWMLSGVVPVLINYGLRMLNPTLFLVTACATCAAISVLTGSSWSTIATIGVALMGIGTVMGFHPGWVAGAIISGAYFGDKVSPLSDTTVVASSTCGVDLFEHIRYLLITAVPSMAIALGVYLLVGVFSAHPAEVETAGILKQLSETFVLSPWVLVIPALTVAMIALRVPTLWVLCISSLLGLAGIFVFQPEIAALITDSGAASGVVNTLWKGYSFATGHEIFDNLISTSGITGMLGTIALVLCAMLFGTAMIGTGMLSVITHAFTRKLRGRSAIVGSTVGSGLFLNCCTADQYLSIIIGGNMMRQAYRRASLEPRLLSRTLEDSVSVTSVLIPWNSCGVTQSTVLGVSTLVYLPFCIFNILSPVMSLVMAFTGFKISKHHHRTHTRRKSGIGLSTAGN